MTKIEGWKASVLSDLVTINYGQSPTNILANDGPYPVIGTGSRQRKGNDYIYDGESIILGRKGSIDQVLFIKGKFWAIDTAYYLTRFEKTVPLWLYYSLQSIDFRQLNEATGVPSLSRNLLYEIPISTPPKIEQHKIAHILSTVDQAIEQTEALIAKQQRIKAGLMQDLLTRGIDEQGNLRSEKTHQFKDWLLGKIPVEWEFPSIASLALHVRSGITPRGGEAIYKKEGILFIRSQNVHPMGLMLEEIAYISPVIHQSMARSEVFKNDVLLNITGASIGRCCYLPEIGLANVNQHVCSIRLPNASDVDAQFLASVMQSSIGQRQIAQLNAGGNREGLNYEQVKSFIIPWPCARERALISNILHQSNETLRLWILYRRYLYSLKTALMQDLLTGRKRVTALLPKEEIANV